MKKRNFLNTLAMATLLCSTHALSQEKFKIGLILPMTGPFASTGKQIEAAAKLYMAQNGDTVAGKKVELIVKELEGSTKFFPIVIASNREALKPLAQKVADGIIQAKIIKWRQEPTKKTGSILKSH